MLPCTGNVNAMPRKLSCKLVIGGNDITDVKLLTYASDWSGNITVGQVVSSYISVTVPTPSFSIAGLNVTLYMGIDLPVEWVLIGNFRISEDSIRTRQGYTSFKAFDKLYNTINTYHPTVTYGQNGVTLQQIFSDVCTQIGVSGFDLYNTYGISKTFTADTEILEDLDGYTLRDVLGFIAAYCGKNVYLAPNGTDLQFRWFANVSYTADNTKANVPYIGESNCTVERLICQTSDGVITTSNSGQGIYFTCPFMDSTRLNAMLNGLSLTYRKADVDIPYGSFLLQSGDIITVTTVQNQTLSVPIMNNSFTYDGGVSSAVSAYGVSDYSGTANNAERSLSVRRVQRKLAVNRAHSELETATKIITGASGGYIKINFGGDGKTAELLIMDTNDITTAQNVWVFNQNGLGHFPNGYNVGQVNLALLMNGTIVAERIAGEMISGVGIENIDRSFTTKPRIKLADGCIAIDETYSYDGQTEQVTSIGKLEYLRRSGVNNPATLALTCQLGNNITIGEYGYPKYAYHSQPTGTEKMHHFYGDVKFFDGVYVGDSLISSAALANIVDNGAKNRLEVNLNILKSLNNGTHYGFSWSDNVCSTSSGITFTYNSDSSITVNGTAQREVWFKLNAFTYLYKEYVISGCPNGGSSSTYFIESDRYNIRDYGESAEVPNSIYDTDSIYIVVKSGATLNNLTFYPMICEKILWKISQQYAPYAPTNRELYDMIQNL